MNVLILTIAVINAITWLVVGMLFYTMMRNKQIFRGTAFQGAEMIHFQWTINSGQIRQLSWQLPLVYRGELHHITQFYMDEVRDPTNC